MWKYCLLLLMTAVCAAEPVWRSGFPPGLAKDPAFFRPKTEEYGIKLPDAACIGYYDRDFRTDFSKLRGCRITAEAVTDPAENVFNNVLMIATWRDAEGKPVQRDYVDFTDTKDGVRHFDRTFAVPGDAVKLSLRLIAKWRAGSTVFRNVRVRKAEAPAKRTVRLVTVSLGVPYHPDRPNTVEENFAHFEEVLNGIGKKVQNPDLIALPEAVAYHRTPVAEKHLHAEPVPGGRLFRLLSRYAAKYHCYIVGCTEEKDEKGVMRNTAFIVDRQGKFAGKYHKVHVSTREMEKGVIPGNSFPVFNLDFGRVGLLICWDNWFGESARILRLNGAELLVYPIAGDGQHEHWNHVWPARAIDNSIPIVTSIRSNGSVPSCIIDRSGFFKAATWDHDGIAAADIDLDARMGVRGLSVGPARGDPHQVYEFERRPEMYHKAIQSNKESQFQKSCRRL